MCVLCNVHLHENPHTIMYAYARQHHVQYCTCILDPCYTKHSILHTQVESDSLECLFPSYGNVSVLDGWNNDIPDNTVDENQVCNHCTYCMREYCIHVGTCTVRIHTYVLTLYICMYTHTLCIHVHTTIHTYTYAHVHTTVHIHVLYIHSLGVYIHTPYIYITLCVFFYGIVSFVCFLCVVPSHIDLLLVCGVFIDVRDKISNVVFAPCEHRVCSRCCFVYFCLSFRLTLN